MTEEIKKTVKCDKCEKEFGSQEALNMHKNSKHGEKIKDKKSFKTLTKKANKKSIILGIIILLLIGIGAYYLTLNNDSGNKYDNFAKCLTEKNATMYGAFWCQHCKDQKKAFGSSFQYINYIECSAPDGKSQLEICKDAKIDGYPTWEFNDGTRRGGFVPLSDLASMSNCSLE